MRGGSVSHLFKTGHDAGRMFPPFPETGWWR